MEKKKKPEGASRPKTFDELVRYCKRRGYRFNRVGLAFYRATGVWQLWLRSNN